MYESAGNSPVSTSKRQEGMRMGGRTAALKCHPQPQMAKKPWPSWGTTEMTAKLNGSKRYDNQTSCDSDKGVVLAGGGGGSSWAPYGGSGLQQCLQHAGRNGATCGMGGMVPGSIVLLVTQVLHIPLPRFPVMWLSCLCHSGNMQSGIWQSCSRRAQCSVHYVYPQLTSKRFVGRLAFITPPPVSKHAKSQKNDGQTSSCA